jgi:DNA-binding IscR family transcriptional regulator
MFSQTAEYALPGVIVLARDPEKTWPAQPIAEQSLVPQDSLIKVPQRLPRERLATAQRAAEAALC